MWDVRYNGYGWRVRFKLVGFVLGSEVVVWNCLS